MLDPLLTVTRRIWFRGKHRILNPFVPLSGNRTAEIFGGRVELDLSALIQRSICMGTFEREETDAIESLLKPGMSFLDIGANVGYFTTLARSRVGPEGQVHAYEPSPWAFERLSRMISENRWSNVKAVNAGLAETEGELALYLGEAGNHTPTMVPHEQHAIARVAVKRLDDEFQFPDGAAIDVVKMDVEEFEPNVIRGGQRFFASGCVKVVLAEFNSHWLDLNGSSIDALYGLFEKCNFRLTKSFGLNRIYTHRTA